MNGRMDNEGKFAMLSLSRYFYIYIIIYTFFWPFERLKKWPWAEDLFIKFDSIRGQLGYWYFLENVRLDVIPSNALAIFYFFNDFHNLYNWYLMKIVWLDNLIIKVTFKCCSVILDINTDGYMNTNKIGIELICTCFSLTNIDSVKLNGGANWSI